MLKCVMTQEPRPSWVRAVQVAASDKSNPLPPTSTLRMAMRRVPPLAWQPLTPQLFSLLAHDRVRVSIPVNASCITRLDCALEGHAT